MGGASLSVLVGFLSAFEQRLCHDYDGRFICFIATSPSQYYIYISLLELFRKFGQRRCILDTSKLAFLNTLDSQCSN